MRRVERGDDRPAPRRPAPQSLASQQRQRLPHRLARHARRLRKGPLDHALAQRQPVGSGAIKLLDEAGCEVPDGEVGERYSRTACVFDGDWKNAK
jgi:hypothetical protein